MWTVTRTSRCRQVSIGRLQWLRCGCICGLGITSVPVSWSRTLILLGQISGHPVLLRFNTKPTRALSIGHPLTPRASLIHGTYRDSSVPWLMLVLVLLVLNARRGRGQPLMLAGLKRRHRGRAHAIRATASTETTHFSRRLWGGGGGRRVKTVIRCSELRCDVQI